MTIVESVFLFLSVGVALSIVWSTLRTGISPTMSSGKACKAMLDSVKTPNNGPVIDLGSGWGTLVVAAARQHPQQAVIGYELSWFPWLVSVIRKHSLGLGNLSLYRSDFSKADIGDASVLFCYLFPKSMAGLYEKLVRERLDDVLIVSNTFALPGCEPANVVRLSDLYRSPVYVYHWQSAPLVDPARAV